MQVFSYILTIDLLSFNLILCKKKSKFQIINTTRWCFLVPDSLYISFMLYIFGFLIDGLDEIILTYNLTNHI